MCRRQDAETEDVTAARRRWGAWRRLPSRLRRLLEHGITPPRLALALALGTAIGFFPVPGTTIPLCAAAAALLGLNQVAIQAGNAAAGPLYLLTILPFARLGERITGAAPFPISAGEIRALAAGGPIAFLRALGGVAGHAILGWCVAAPVTTAALFALLLPLLRRWGRRVPHAAGKPGGGSTR